MFTGFIGIEFSTSIIEASIVGLDVGTEGLILEAFDSAGYVVATDSIDPCALLGFDECSLACPGGLPPATLSVSGTDLICILP